MADPDREGFAGGTADGFARGRRGFVSGQGVLRATATASARQRQRYDGNGRERRLRNAFIMSNARLLARLNCELLSDTFVIPRSIKKHLITQQCFHVMWHIGSRV